MTEETTHPAQMLRTRDQQFRELYANSSQTHVSPFDITLLFQKNSELVPGQMGATDLVSVTMSPQHFKAFVKSAAVTLEAYESTFGKLAISETDTTPLRTAAEVQSALETARTNARAAVAAAINPSSTVLPPPSQQSHGASRKKGK
ncbi:MAG TPA: DUF3467 domain-containing protein [Roseiarcus sp.]|jgi:hypothetical protein